MDNLFNSNSIGGILIRFLFNLVFLVILIRLLYFRYSKKEKFMFTNFLIGISVFFICSMLKGTKLEIGMGFGLFAIFQILRFRTRNVGVKDMAYTLAVIGISVINSLNMSDFPFIGFLIIDSVILLCVFLLEEYMKRNNFSQYTIYYNDLSMLKPGNRTKLIKDISSKTGLEIIKVEIRNLDFRKDTAEIEVYFKE